MAAANGSAHDWQRWYGDRSAWPATDDLFLADAVCRLGTMMVFPFHDDTPLAAGHQPLPFIPDVDEAFDDDGTPIAAVHAAWAPAILTRWPAADFFDATMRIHDHSAWLQAHTFDPASGMTKFDLSKTLHRADEVVQDHWNMASLETGLSNSLRDAARDALPHVARTIARMAIAGDIETYGLAIDGSGGELKLVPGDWTIFDPVSRIATCGVDAAAMRATDREPTHLLFVRKARFDTAAWVAARADPLSLIEEGLTPEDVGLIGPRTATANDRLKTMAVQAMRAHLLDNPDDYQRPKLRAVVERAVGRIGEKLFEKARDEVRAEFPHIRAGGPPIGGERREAAIGTEHLKRLVGGTNGDGSNVVPITPPHGRRRGTTDPD